MRPKGGWKSVVDVEVAVAEFETNHWATLNSEHYRKNPVLNEVGSN